MVFPKGWYQKSFITSISLGENVFLQKEVVENSIIRFYLYVDESKTLVPNWFFEEVFAKHQYPAFCCWKYYYLNEDFTDYYLYSKKMPL